MSVAQDILPAHKPWLTDPVTLTKRQEAFCVAYSGGVSGAEAYRRVGKRTYAPGVASERARRWLRLPKIRARVLALTGATPPAATVTRLAPPSADIEALEAVVSDNSRADDERLAALRALTAGLAALGAASFAFATPPIAVTFAIVLPATSSNGASLGSACGAPEGDL